MTTLHLVASFSWERKGARAQWDANTKWPDGFPYEKVMAAQAYNLENRKRDDSG